MNFTKRGPRYGESDDGKYSICNSGMNYTAAVRNGTGWTLLTSKKYRQGDEVSRQEAWSGCVAACDKHKQENDNV